MNPFCEGWSAVDTCSPGEVRSFEASSLPVPPWFKGRKRLCRACYEAMGNDITNNPLFSPLLGHIPKWEEGEVFDPHHPKRKHA